MLALKQNYPKASPPSILILTKENSVGNVSVITEEEIDILLLNLERQSS